MEVVGVVLINEGLVNHGPIWLYLDGTVTAAKRVINITNVSPEMVYLGTTLRTILYISRHLNLVKRGLPSSLFITLTYQMIPVSSLFSGLTVVISNRFPSREFLRVFFAVPERPKRFRGITSYSSVSLNLDELRSSLKIRT